MLSHRLEEYCEGATVPHNLQGLQALLQVYQAGKGRGLQLGQEELAGTTEDHAGMSPGTTRCGRG